MDVQAEKAAGCALIIGVLGKRSADWFAPCPPDHMVRDLSEVPRYLSLNLLYKPFPCGKGNKTLARMVLS